MEVQWTEDLRPFTIDRLLSGMGRTIMLEVLSLSAPMVEVKKLCRKVITLIHVRISILGKIAEKKRPGRFFWLSGTDHQFPREETLARYHCGDLIKRVSDHTVPEWRGACCS